MMRGLQNFYACIKLKSKLRRCSKNFWRWRKIIGWCGLFAKNKKLTNKKVECEIDCRRCERLKIYVLHTDIVCSFFFFLSMNRCNNFTCVGFVCNFFFIFNFQFNSKMKKKIIGDWLVIEWIYVMGEKYVRKKIKINNKSTVENHCMHAVVIYYQRSGCTMKEMTNA